MFSNCIGNFEPRVQAQRVVSLQRWGAARTAISGLPYGLQSLERPRVTTTPRRPEPAWHRRERAQRSQQRLLLRAVGASSALAQHHGTAMAPPCHKESPKADWYCKSCKGRDGKPFRNFGHRAECHLCHISKGSCFWKKIDPGPPRAGPTFAERQVLQQKLDEKYAKKLQQKDAELARLKEQLRKRGDTAGGEDASTEQEEAKEDIEAELEQLKAHVKALEKIPGAEVVLAEKQAELEAAVQKRQAARPVRQRLRGLQSKLDRKEKTLKKRQDTELPILRNAVEAAQQALSQAENEIQDLEAGVAELRTQRDKLRALEPAEGLGAAAHATAWMPGPDLRSALDRLATVVEALPRAYDAGNMAVAYDGIMASLREAVALASEPLADDADAAPMDGGRDDDSDIFPWPDPSTEVIIEDSDIEGFPDVAGVDDEESRRRIRSYMQDFVRKAKRVKR